MLVAIYKEDGQIIGQTDGCGCCSRNIDDKEDILVQLKQNLRVLENAASVLDIPLQELLFQLSFE